MNLDAVRVRVAEVLSQRRFAHVLGVVETAVALARLHGEDVARAELSALLHDVAKEMPVDEMERILISSGYDDYLGASRKVWHAPVGRVVARLDYGVMDDDVLNAILYHTTGRAGMSRLEKIIYVADYTEPGRLQPGVDVVRANVAHLDIAVFLTLEQTIQKLGEGSDIHGDTLAAYHDYKAKVGN